MFWGRNRPHFGPEPGQRYCIIARQVIRAQLHWGTIEAALARFTTFSDNSGFDWA
jgi:cytochrome b